MFGTSKNKDYYKLFDSFSKEDITKYEQNAINRKVSTLQNQRGDSKNFIKDKYKTIKMNEDTQDKLLDKNKTLLNLYDQSILNNSKDLSHVDQEYLDMRRQIQINNYEYSKRKSSVLMLCVMFFALTACILVGLVGSTGIMSINTKRLAIGIIVALFIVYLIMHSMKNSNRSKYDWDMYNWGSTGSGVNNVNNPFTDATGYNNESLLCTRHPNMCKINDVLTDTTLNTKTKLYETDKIYDDMKKVRKNDYCELQQIEAYYKEMKKQRNTLYNKRKNEIIDEINKKKAKLNKELKKYQNSKENSDITDLDKLKCSLNES